MGARRLYRDLSLNIFSASALIPRRLRWRLLRFFGMEIGAPCTVAPGCWFGGVNVRIGADSTINYGVFFDNSAKITIGDRVDIGMQVMICTGTHTLGSQHRRAGEAYGERVLIGDGTWIGTRAVIMPGLSIGAGCVVAAGAIVTRDCEANGVYAGAPARRIRDIAP